MITTNAVNGNKSRSVTSSTWSASSRGRSRHVRPNDSRSRHNPTLPSSRKCLCTAGTTGYPSAGITGLGHLGQSRLCEDHLDQIEKDMSSLNGKDCLGLALFLSLWMTLAFLHEAG